MKQPNKLSQFPNEYHGSIMKQQPKRPKRPQHVDEDFQDDDQDLMLRMNPINAQKHAANFGIVSKFI